MQHSSLCCSQPALCGMHALPALCTNWSFSSPAGLFHVAHQLCATCMWCLFGPPDWSVCHPVASPTCLQVQALLALCHLHVVPVWPSRLVSLSSSSPLLLAYRCRPYLLCLPDWPVISRMQSTFSAAFLLCPTWMSSLVQQGCLHCPAFSLYAA